MPKKGIPKMGGPLRTLGIVKILCLQGFMMGRVLKVPMFVNLWKSVKCLILLHLWAYMVLPTYPQVIGTLSSPFYSI
jgi:hypothetical protein